MIDNKTLQVVSREEIISFLKSKFSRIKKEDCIKLAAALVTTDSNNRQVEVRQFKDKYKEFVRRNPIYFDTVTSDESKNGVTYYYIKKDKADYLFAEIVKLLDQIGSSLKDIQDTDDAWEKDKCQDMYLVKKHTTFQDIREKVDAEGKDVNFKYDFESPDLELTNFNNKMTLQMVKVHVNDNGEYFGFPLRYYYYCPECNNISDRKEYEVASSNGAHINCPAIVQKENKDGSVSIVKCNEYLIPDTNRTETKDTYIYSISYRSEDGFVHKADAISFKELPKGQVKVVLQKLPRAYGNAFVHIVDYKKIDNVGMPLPERVDGEHYMFTLVRAIDDYILEQANYYHYGYLPIKIAHLIQFAARYLPNFRNDLNIALSGGMSTGKSKFSIYWGLALYSQSAWKSNATSISIPKLRGTMESVRLFNKEHRYQYRGLFGTYDLIIIDEVKENPDVKNNLKQYLLEPDYEFSRQGGSNQTFNRTAHVNITQNIDTTFLSKYEKDVRYIYTSDEYTPVVSKDEPKPVWSDSVDLTLPLYSYTNHYLIHAINRVRKSYERNGVNWIDGSEIALKQRFYFYYYLSAEKQTAELTRVVRENIDREVVSNYNELTQLFNMDNLKNMIVENQHLVKSDNELAYFDKVDELLKEYGKFLDTRTKTMSYTILKIIRMIDGRGAYTDKDLEIFQYLLESIDNKIEVADTNEFVVHGPRSVATSRVEESFAERSDDWGVESSLDSFE